MTKPTRITNLFSIKHPIVQAPLADVASPELVAAVSNTGGIGTIAGGFLSIVDLENEIDSVRALTDKPFIVNLFVDNSKAMTPTEIKQAITRLSSFRSDEEDTDFEELSHENWQLEDMDDLITVILEKEVPVVSFSLGIPEDSIISILKESGVKIIGTATHMIEALLWQEKGADAIFFQGVEAGGIRSTFIGNSIKFAQTAAALASQAAHTLRIPYIISGGIYNQRSYYAMLFLGADAVGLGTAFLMTHESKLSDECKQKVVNSNEFDSTLTKEWTGVWGRCLVNDGLKKIRNKQGSPARFPTQAFLLEALSKQVDDEKQMEFKPIWAGINAQYCQQVSVETLIYKVILGLSEPK